MRFLWQSTALCDVSSVHRLVSEPSRWPPQCSHQNAQRDVDRFPFVLTLNQNLATSSKACLNFWHSNLHQEINELTFCCKTFESIRIFYQNAKKTCLQQKRRLSNYKAGARLAKICQFLTIIADMLQIPWGCVLPKISEIGRYLTKLSVK